MSPYKPAHDVSCAHCVATVATVVCSRCSRMVCGACEEDFTRCEAPRKATRTHKLGRMTHVLAVDAEANQVVAARFGGRGRPCVFGISPERERRLVLRNSVPPSRVAAWSKGYLASFDGTDAACWELRRGQRIRSATVCGCGGHVTRLYTNELVSTSALGEEMLGTRRETVRGRVITGCFYDCKTRILGVSVQRAIYFFACDESYQVTRRIATLKLKPGETLLAHRIYDGHVSVLTRLGFNSPHRPPVGGDVHRLEVFRCHAGGVQSLAFFEWISGSHGITRARASEPHVFAPARESLRVVEPPILAVREDGVVALGLSGRQALIIDAESATLSLGHKHSSRLVFAGFAGTRLVTADVSGVVAVGPEMPRAN